jgi:hypothetical protein
MAPEDEGEDNNLPPMSEAQRAWWDIYWKLRDRVIMLAMQEAMNFYAADPSEEGDNARRVVSDEFDKAVHDFAFHNITYHTVQ